MESDIKRTVWQRIPTEKETRCVYSRAPERLKSAIKRPKNCEIIYLRREASEFDTCFKDAHGVKHPALLAVYSKGELEQ